MLTFASMGFPSPSGFSDACIRVRMNTMPLVDPFFSMMLSLPVMLRRRSAKEPALRTRCSNFHLFVCRCRADTIGDGVANQNVIGK